MDDLERKYQLKYTEYEAAIATHKPASKIQALNQELAAILTQMLVILSDTQTETKEMNVYRDRLTEKLTKIQNEYNTLSADNDSIQTLKSRRTYQESTFSGAFFWYMIGLVLASLAFVVLLFYKVSARPAITPSPSSMPPLI